MTPSSAKVASSHTDMIPLRMRRKDLSRLCVTRSWGVTHAGGRATNQDFLASDDELGIYVVADGVESEVCGDYASQLATEAVVGELAATAASVADPATHLVQSIHRAHGKLCADASQHTERAGMATTLAVLQVLADGKVALAHLGNSRIYRLRAGVLERMTVDHVVSSDESVGSAVASQMTGNWVADHLLTRTLSTRTLPFVEASCHEARSGDLFLLCSDGLHDVLDDDQLLNRLEHRYSLRVRGQELLADALARRTADNVTVLLVEIG